MVYFATRGVGGGSRADAGPEIRGATAGLQSDTNGRMWWGAGGVSPSRSFDWRSTGIGGESCDLRAHNRVRSFRPLQLLGSSVAVGGLNIQAGGGWAQLGCYQSPGLQLNLLIFPPC